MTLATEPDHPVLLRGLSLGMTPSVAKGLSAANIIAMGRLLNDDARLEMEKAADHLLTWTMQLQAELLQLRIDGERAAAKAASIDISNNLAAPDRPEAG